MTPCTTLPYIFFSPNAPYAVMTARSGSESSRMPSDSFSRNFPSFSGLSGEMPSTS